MWRIRVPPATHAGPSAGGVPCVTSGKNASCEGWKLADENPARHGWYHDLRTWAWFREHEKDWHPYPTTLPTNVIVALNAALGRIFEQGIEDHMARIRSAAIHTREGMDKFGFKMLPDPAFTAPMLSAFYALAGMKVGDFMRDLREEHGLMISGGLGDLTGRIFRVGHMGAANKPEIVEELLTAVESYLKRAK